MAQYCEHSYSQEVHLAVEFLQVSNLPYIVNILFFHISLSCFQQISCLMYNFFQCCFLLKFIWNEILSSVYLQEALQESIW